MSTFDPKLNIINPLTQNSQSESNAGSVKESGNNPLGVFDGEFGNDNDLQQATVMMGELETEFENQSSALDGEQSNFDTFFEAYLSEATDAIFSGINYEFAQARNKEVKECYNNVSNAITQNEANQTAAGRQLTANQEQINSNNNNIARRLSHLYSLNSQSASLNTKIEADKATLSADNAWLSSAPGRITDIQGRISENKTLSSGLQSSIDSKNAELTGLKGVVTANVPLRTAMNSAKAKYDAAFAKYNQIDMAIKGFDKAIGDIDAKILLLESPDSSFSSMTISVPKIVNGEVQLDANGEPIMEEVPLEVEEGTLKEDQIKYLESEKAKLTAQKDELGTSLSAAQEEVSLLEGEYNTAEAAYNAVKEETENAEAKIPVLESEISQLAIQKKQTDAVVSQLEKDLGAVRSEQSMRQERASRLPQEIQQLESQKASIDSAAQTEENEIATLRSQNSSLGDSNSSLQEIVTQAIGKIAEDKIKLVAMEPELDQAQRTEDEKFDVYSKDLKEQSAASQELEKPSSDKDKAENLLSKIGLDLKNVVSWILSLLTKTDEQVKLPEQQEKKDDPEILA